ncbi:MAG: sulfurtransferase [Brachymonas sp.]|nr:sulfurtransferase [Brachymonas sp.]
MSYSTLISVEQLRALQQQGAPLMVFDCSYDLSDVAAGRTQYEAAHIPGARYADLNDDLSSFQPERAASAGRHPLPLREDFEATLRQWGFSNQTQAVVYDRNGCNYCGRLWWMLKWLGHDAVAVLDGGLQAWQAAGYATETGPAAPASGVGNFTARPSLVELVATETVAQNVPDGDLTLIDARGPARYRGDTEPLDPIAGHIPGAINRPFSDNLGADGHFKSADVLKAELAALLPHNAHKKNVVYCGSGVSAVGTLLAMELAGLPRPALYAGSWSAWSNTPGLPVEQG